MSLPHHHHLHYLVKSNIQSNTRLELALRALDKMSVDLCFLTEAKLTDGVYTRCSPGCHVVATEAMSPQRGGVALAYRDEFAILACRVDSMSWAQCYQLCAGVGVQTTTFGGGYIPPEDETTLEHVDRALRQFHSTAYVG